MGELSADAVDGEAEGSLALELGNWSAINGMEGADGDYVRDSVVDSV